MTGLFAHQTRSHRGPGRQAIVRRRAFSREKLANFAEALAETGTITAAAARCGVSQQQGSKWFAQIRRELGWQAQ